MLATTIEQSETLIRIGVDINTADMYWQRVGAFEYELRILNERDKKHCFDYNIPAWSLSALIDLVSGIKDILYVSHSFNSYEHSFIARSKESTCVTAEDDPISACVKLLHSLIKPRLI